MFGEKNKNISKSKDKNFLDLKKTFNSKFKEIQDEDIYVMPAKFLEKKEKGGKKIFILFGGIFLILAIIASGIFLFNKNAKEAFLKPVQNGSAIKIDNDKQPVDLKKNNENIEIAQTIKAEVKNKDGNIVSRAQITLPFGFTDSEEKFRVIGQYPPKSYFMIDPRQDIIGGIYTFVPSDVKLKRSITLILGYDEKIVDKYKEKNFRVGYLENGKWNYIEAQQDIENNAFTITLLELKDVYAILVPKTDEMLAGLGDDLDLINPNILSATTDADFDGLTDVEEGLYQTDLQRADTDLGGSPDGWEIIKLFSPIDEGSYPLSNSGLIKVYTNLTYKYSIFYQRDFLIKVIDNKVSFTPQIETGESIILFVQENPEQLKSKEWYVKQFKEKEIDEFKLKTSIVDGVEGVWSLDAQNFYLAKDNLVYVFSYNSGTLARLNFKSTFKMMINSFKFSHEGEKAEPQKEEVKEKEAITTVESTELPVVKEVEKE